MTTKNDETGKQHSKFFFFLSTFRFMPLNVNASIRILIADYYLFIARIFAPFFHVNICISLLSTVVSTVVCIENAIQS